MAYFYPTGLDVDPIDTSTRDRHTWIVDAATVNGYVYLSDGTRLLGEARLTPQECDQIGAIIKAAGDRILQQVRASK